MVTVFCKGTLNALALAFLTSYGTPTNPTPKEKTRMKPGIEGLWLASGKYRCSENPTQGPDEGDRLASGQERTVGWFLEPDEEKPLSKRRIPVYRRVRRVH